MNGERQHFLDLLHALEDIGVEDEVIAELGLAFGSYENDLAATTQFVISRMGDIAVCDTIEAAQELANATLSEVTR